MRSRSCGADPCARTEANKCVGASSCDRVSADGVFGASVYKASYGCQRTSTLGGRINSLCRLSLNEFLFDTQRIGRGVIVGQTGWEQVLENNKQAFCGEFVQRTRFATAFASTLNPAQFVDALFQPQ